MKDTINALVQGLTTVISINYKTKVKSPEYDLCG